ncbi:SDR family NAD(P)-dependent oxidoreductase [Amycolatopsis viridis]|uniref:3-oxoacyl-[acyl-carrier protein] reductase n=1 Tax=Amycolatopsis viridis TaxID=185678 RepID=A0ABX0T0L8_9PSEU|nr:SDR family oxidoreductase [Amycolatopsis viridis]NIH82771.1 3-oxoacyl-[acyl-carrier protein] reductase [Amycolatopsis viridis]
MTGVPVPPGTSGSVLVVGGSSGIGLATALLLAEAGRRVLVAARGGERLAEVAEIAERKKLPLETRVVDVRSERSVDALFAALDEAGEPVTACVNTAGRNLSRRLLVPPGDDGGQWLAHSERDWQDTLDLNLTGTFRVARAAALLFARQRRGGVIVTVASSTWRGSWGQPAYAAAKAGIVSLTRSLALELADHGIRVVCVAPGVIDGAALRDKCARKPAHAAHMARLRERIPLRRFATESEVARTIVHAIDNEYLTGNVLEVDGGGFPGRIA